MNDVTKADILVVDDTPDNLNLLKNILSDAGYHVRTLPHGGLVSRSARFFIHRYTQMNTDFFTWFPRSEAVPAAEFEYDKMIIKSARRTLF